MELWILRQAAEASNLSGCHRPSTVKARAWISSRLTRSLKRCQDQISLTKDHYEMVVLSFSDRNALSNDLDKLEVFQQAHRCLLDHVSETSCLPREQATVTVEIL